MISCVHSSHCMKSVLYMKHTLLWFQVSIQGVMKPNRRREENTPTDWNNVAVMPIKRTLYLNFFNWLLKYTNIYLLFTPTLNKSICAHFFSHTHTQLLPDQRALHCQVELGQYYNSQSVGEGLCVVIHFKSCKCSYR